MFFKQYLTLLISVLSFAYLKCSLEEERLIKTLFKSYNKLIRPVRNSSDYVIITMDLVLLQLINVVRIIFFFFFGFNIFQVYNSDSNQIHTLCIV